MNTSKLPVGDPLPNWQAAKIPPQTSMVGKYCRVEPCDIEKHSADLFAAFATDTDKVNCTYLPYGPFDTLTDLQTWMRKACTGKDPMFHTVVDLRSGKAVGLAALMRIEPSVGVIEVGNIHFSPLLQRTPLSTEAIFLLMSRVFDDLGYRRFEWKCDSLNGPSNRSAVRYGFQFEGTFRQALVYRNRNRDTNWYSILDGEWPAIKSAYQAWLNEDNFDDDGVQKSKLVIRKT